MHNKTQKAVAHAARALQLFGFYYVYLAKAINWRSRQLSRNDNFCNHSQHEQLGMMKD
jgi:hypothetical protein